MKTLLSAEKAVEDKNWVELERLTEKLHKAGYYLDKTLFWRACALQRLDRNEEALVEFEKIQGELDTIEEEATRYWNHTLALYRIGRSEESFKFLMDKINPDWPTELYWKSRSFLSDHGFKAFKIKV